ncbi:MAG TPA: hypothetical protein VKN76_14085 [Kiloniellaceae bacterium]|nr:hypothetical protein [Kiloniellaceae bacterium]
MTRPPAGWGRRAGSWRSIRMMPAGEETMKENVFLEETVWREILAPRRLEVVPFTPVFGSTFIVRPRPGGDRSR